MPLKVRCKPADAWLWRLAGYVFVDGGFQLWEMAHPLAIAPSRGRA